MSRHFSSCLNCVKIEETYKTDPFNTERNREYMMKPKQSLLSQTPDSFWSLFRSSNRQVYMDALMQINEEYEYSNYYLSRETCIQILSSYFSGKKVCLEKEELEEETDLLEPTATRILNWLLRTQWLRKVDDYQSMTVHIVIPDYAAVFIEAFERLSRDEEDETQIYIQNIHAVLFAFKNDPNSSVSLLRTAAANTRKLNKILMDMLHNMDRFFGHLLEAGSYEELLQEHLEGYVEEVVQKKYHMLKTSDNFYLYKTDIKQWIHDMREDLPWLEQVCQRNRRQRRSQVQVEELLEQLDLIERGFDDIEHRIANMDKEHSRYVRATVTRMNYLLNEEDNMKGLVIQLLNHLSLSERQEEEIEQIGRRMNFSQFAVLSDKSFYKRRKPKTDFTRRLAAEEEPEELSMEEVLRLNRIRNRYSRKQVDEFILSQMTDGVLEVTGDTIATEEDFEKLVLAYDYSSRKGSPYRVRRQETAEIDNGSYRYPDLIFERRN